MFGRCISEVTANNSERGRVSDVGQRVPAVGAEWRDMDMILGREVPIVLNFEQYSTTGGLRRVKRQPEAATRDGNQKRQKAENGKR
ncbi:MAG: hypothetical protein ABSG91_20600, partial [Syntrophobacteraceae bacterium]